MICACCCSADDMGLGKTLTMISLLLKQRDEDRKMATTEDGSGSSWLSVGRKSRLRSAASLVVCPASLVHQWKSEIERRVKHGTLNVVLYHGANRVVSPARYIMIDRSHLLGV